MAAGSLMGYGAEQLNFRSSPMTAGKASLSENGYIVSRELGGANFSPELRYPVQLIYRSDSADAGLFGTSWRSPQLESSAIPEKDGVLWTTPWGEKIRFFAKTKDKDALDLYKDAMKGPKPYFSPYSEWEADGKEGNWIFYGKRTLEGWKLAYRDAKLIAITAPSGRKIEFGYYDGRPTAVTQDGKAFLELSYDGNLVKELKINGVAHQLAYASGKLLVLPETVNGKAAELMRARLTAIASTGTAPVQFGYDKDGYLAVVKQDKFVDKIAVEHETEAQRLNYLKAVAEKQKPQRIAVAGRIKADRFFNYRYLSDKPGQLVLTDRAKREAKFDYNAETGIFKTTGFNGLTQTIYYFKRYDVAYNGKVRQIVDGRDRVVVSYRYDKLTGQVSRIRDIAGNEIYFTSNKLGEVELVERRAANQLKREPVAAFRYDAKRNPIASMQLDQSGKPAVETRIRYNAYNQPTNVSDGQSETSIVYNRNGYPSRVGNVFEQFTSFEYDRYNRLISATAPNGVTTKYAYDEAGRIAKMARLDGEELLSSLEIAYNRQGLPAQYRDHKGRVKSAEYNELGKVVKEFLPNETSVEYLYDSIGQLAKVLDQNRHEINFNYNGFGLAGKRTAENQLTSYLHDKNGMLSAVISRFADQKQADRKIGYEYDDCDRLVKADYGKGQVETFQYNSWGKLIASSKVDATAKRSATYAYDYFGRMTEKIETAVENGKESKTVSRYAYNNYGQRIGRVTTADGVTFSEKREYDEFGRLAKIVSGSDTVTYAYNTKNQLVTRTTNGIAVRYSYTKLGQLAAKSIAGMEDTASLKYFYDKDGTISGREVGGVKQSYKYDKIGQLLAVIDPAGKEVEKYVYDPAGNILSKTVAGKTTTYTYDKANQLVSSTNADGKVTKYEYDAAGRMTKEGEKTFAYGWLDKVMQVAENGKTTQTYTYDMLGQLAIIDHGAIKETFLWDGLTLLSRNSLKYVNEPAITGGKPILAGDKMLFDDLLGNTLGVKEGEKFSAIGRDAFGELSPGEKPNLAVNFFTGKPEIDNLGYSFLFRNYRADLGKWQIADPAGYPDGWNNFAYVNNNVISCVDLLGYATIFIGGASEHTATNTVADFMNSRCPKCGARLGGTTTKPYAWDQKDDIIAFIKSLPPGESITLLGHSYGGDTAYLVARDCGRSIDTLITFDPVSRFTFNISMPENTQSWYNIYVTGDNYGSGDLIADIGGQWGAVDGATNIAAPDLQHGDVAGMMNYATTPTSNGGGGYPGLWGCTHVCE